MIALVAFPSKSPPVNCSFSQVVYKNGNGAAFDAEPEINDWLNKSRWGHFDIALFMKVIKTSQRLLPFPLCLFLLNAFLKLPHLLLTTSPSDFVISHMMQCEGVITESAGLAVKICISHCLISSMIWSDYFVLLGILKGQLYSPELIYSSLLHISISKCSALTQSNGP